MNDSTEAEPDKSLVTVLPGQGGHGYSWPRSAENRARRLVQGSAVPLAEALATRWHTFDAHVCQYAPVVIQGEVRRLRQAALKRSGFLRRHGGITMVSLLHDIDGAGHKASPEWRRETEAKLRRIPTSSYATRGGYRLVWALATPCVIHDAETWRLWRAFYHATCAWLRAQHGIKADLACADPVRLFRLPDVLRDGERTNSPWVCGSPYRVQPFVANVRKYVTAPPKPRKAVPPPNEWSLSERGYERLVRVLVDVWPPQIPRARRHEGYMALGCVLRRAGVCRADAEAIVRDVLRHVGSTAPETRLRSALDGWDGVGMRATSWGRPEFSEIVGAASAQRVFQILDAKEASK